MHIKMTTALTAPLALALALGACAGSSTDLSAMNPPTAAMGMTAAPDADMQAVLTALSSLGARPIHTLTVAQARSQPSPADAVNRVKSARGLATAPDASVVTQDLTYPTGGTTQPIRVYKPAGAMATNLPVVVYYHGGGWVIANLDVYDATPRSMARNLNAIVVSVEYRKGPESKFPAFMEDANNAYRWVLANAPSWGGDPNNVAVAGESAGGNLAVNVAIAARDNRWTAPKHILSIYPIANADKTLAAKQENMSAAPLATPDLDWFGRHALNAPTETQDPRFNLVGANLRGLPPTTIVLAQIDPLRSDGETLAVALRRAGVRVESRTYEGATHEFFGMADVVRDAYDAQQWSFGRLKSALR